MKLAFVADGHSPIALNWIRYFVNQQHEVHLISSYPCPAELLPGAKVYYVPLSLARFLPEFSAQSSLVTRTSWLSRLRVGILNPYVQPMNRLFTLWQGRANAGIIRRHLQRINPDLVHAMRIPSEGIVAAQAVLPCTPFILSVWGNDFTLHAANHSLTGRQTRHTLRRANALHADCYRDIHLATKWGFDPAKPTIVLPGAGGIDTTLFYPAAAEEGLRQKWQIPVDAPIILNPRGIRDYVRNDVFFQAIPMILKKHPQAVFLCIGMQDAPMAEKWVKELGIGEQVRLLPKLEYQEMPAQFRLATITVSPSLHDGTPNTLLEAMACGCFPIAGDIESVREWIKHRQNGLLFDPNDPHALSDAVVEAIEQKHLRQQAQQHNQKLILERAEYHTSMAKAEGFYHYLITQQPITHNQQPITL